MVRQITGNLFFCAFHRGSGFPSSDFATNSQGQKTPRAARQQLIVAGQIWQDAWRTETILWFFQTRKCQEGNGLQNQYPKYSFQGNEGHFRFGTFKFSVALPHSLDIKRDWSSSFDKPYYLVLEKYFVAQSSCLKKNGSLTLKHSVPLQGTKDDSSLHECASHDIAVHHVI